MREQIAFRHPSPDAEAARRAAEEWGVLSLDELRDCGLSPNQVTARVKKGWLHRIYPRAYAVGHPALPVQGRLLAAVKSVGEDAVLSHFAAAVLWEFVKWDGRYPEVTVARASATSRSGIRIHRTAVLDQRDFMRHEGIPVTTPARTLVDFAAVANYKLLRAAVRRALALHRASVRELAAVSRRLGPRRGARKLRRVLANAEPTRSELEDVVLDLIVDAGFARPEVNRPLLLAGRRVIPDFRWREQRVVVEADSRKWHDNPIARADDAERQALLEFHGEHVVRVTWIQAVSKPAKTVARLHAAGVPAGTS
jgi:very-short-patch-repair endonuclease